MASPLPSDEPDRGGLVRGLGLLEATTLIVGSVIGSGIFVAPSIMAGYVQTPGLLMGLWVTGGILSLFGALAYGEMAAALPRAGGQYVFLKEAFSPLWGFLYGWTFLLAINTGFIAAVAVAFAKYLGVFLPVVGERTALFMIGSYAFTTAQAVALVVIAALTWINITGLRTGATVQNIFTIAKVAAIGASMSKALFAYDAWNSVTFAAEEIRQPEKNLPRALALGTIGIMVVYCAAVAVYLYMVPIDQMYAVQENRIAAEAAQRMIGPAGSALIAVAIMVSTFGCVNGLILAGARVLFAMGRDGLFFRRVAEVHPVHRTPAPALLLQGGVAAALTLTGTYDDLLTQTAFASLLFNTLTVAGLFVLRHRLPDLPRPYRAWGYPVLPAIYLLVSVFFLYSIFMGDTKNSARGLGVVAVGLVAYGYWSRKRT